MPNYTFRLKNASSAIETSIRFQFYKDGLRFMYGTNKTIHPSLWNADSQRARTTKKHYSKFLDSKPQIKTELENINSRLNKIETLTIRYFANIELSNSVPSIKEWKVFLNENIKSSKPKKMESGVSEIYLSDVLKDFVRDISNGRKLIERSNQRYSLGTIKVYRTLLKTFLELEDHLKKKLSISDVSKELAQEWSQFLYITKKSSTSNVGKQHKHFKKVVKDKLLDIHNQNYLLEKQNLPLILKDREIKRIEIGLASFKDISSSSTQVYLTENELSTLLGMKDLAEHHRKYLDVFLCGCYTGLRYSDYSALSKEHIKGKNIEIITHKTKSKVKIPIRPELKKILDRYENVLPRTYEQKMNKYIKEICKIAKIDSMIQVQSSKGGMIEIKSKPKYSLVVTHTARRTAATLMYLSGHHSKDIMSITGHRTLSSFEKYLRITQDESLKRMSNSEFFKGNTLQKVS